MIDVHPLLVHFPIALLSLYAVFELARFRFLVRQPWLFELKAVLLLTGVLGAFVSLASGDIAGEALERSGSGALVEVHSSFAAASTTIFCVLAVIYLVSWLHKERFSFPQKSVVQRLYVLVEEIGLWLDRPFVLVILAALGFISILVTGALGGALAYGPNADPIVSFVYRLFF